MIVWVLLGYAAILLIDTLSIYKNGTRKELWISGGILAVSFVLSVLLSFGVHIPSPAGPLGEWISKLHGL